MTAKTASIDKAAYALIGVVEERLALAYDSKKERLEEAQTILLAQEGTYVRSAIDIVRGTSPAREDGLPSWYKDKSVVNVMGVLAQTAASVITANSPTWIVDPIGEDVHKYQSARGVDKLLQYFYKSNRMETVLDQVALRCVLFGKAGLYIDWDSEARSGKHTDSTIGREGWFVVKPVDLFSIHWEPGVGGIEEAHWCIYESTMHVEQARLYWGDPNINKEDTGDESAQGTTERHIRMVQDLDNQSRYDDGDSDRIRVVKYWEKPGHKYPNGLEIVIAGDTVVEVNDHLLLGEFPVYMMEWRPKPFRDYGQGLGGDLLRLQEDLARTLDALRARRDQEIRPPWVVPKGSLTRGGLSTKPGAINEFNPRLGQPQPMQMTPIGAATGNLLDRETQLMEYVAGIHDATMGQTPTSNATGRLTSFLAELDQRKIGPAIRSLSIMLSDVGRRMVRLWQKFGSESVTISVIGKGHIAEIAEITKKSLLWADISVDVASLMPRTQPLRQETVLNLLQMGFISREQALDELEFGGFNEASGLRGVEALNARAENEKLADFSSQIEENEGQVIAREYDDHQIHINEHIRWIRMENPGPMISAQFKEHIEEHKQHIMKAKQEAMAAEQGVAMPPGGGPAQAGSMAEPGGLPPGMIPSVEPGVDVQEEAELAARAGI
tara:strand:+ start:227 stop:2224 length:1998 start_codon:yes stop_codon:yes gene_type:complete